MKFCTIAGTDFAANTLTLEFPEGADSEATTGTQCASILINDDVMVEETEDFSVFTARGSVTVSPSTIQVFITDNDG